MFSQAVISQSFPGWQDFPKGLHVLLVDDDDAALQEAKVKLAACDHKVTPCSSGQQALAALEERGSSFHIALIEQETSNDAHDRFKLVRAVSQHLPTILMSKTKNVSFIMEGIAAGASEFLQKPLSEDLLKTIWQHVFRKALCSGDMVIPQRLSPPNSPVTSPVCSSGSHPADNSSYSQSSASASDNSVFPNAASTDSQPCTALHNMDVDPPFLTMPQGDVSQDDGHVEDQEKPCLDCNLFLLSSPLASPGPSTPQIEQATRVKLEEDDSLLSQGIINCVKAENDSDIVDDCSTHVVEVKTEVEDSADNIHGFVNQGDQSEGDECNANDFEGLDPKLCDGLEFDCHLGDITLSSDMVSELSGLDTSILDDLSADGSMVLSFDCLDDVDGGNHHMQEADEEALLLAEVAKAEAGMAATATASNLSIINASKMPPSASTMTCTSTTTSSSTSAANVDFEKKADNGSDSDHSSGRGSKNLHSKKKMKVDWTPDLHRRFVQAVEQLGVDKAIPSRILELMGVQCLTRHNIASHLQKYRSHKKHLHAREVEAASWNQRRQFEAMPRPSAQAQSVSRSAPFPIAPSGGPALHVWGHPTPDHFWPKPWQAPDGTFWHQPAPVCMDAWGHPTPFYPQPVLRLPLAPLPGVGNRTATKPMQQPEKMSSCHPAKETVDAAINEVLKNPFTPLPLGLKPPSWESVVSELQRQGIQTLSPAVSS